MNQILYPYITPRQKRHDLGSNLHVFNAFFRTVYLNQQLKRVRIRYFYKTVRRVINESIIPRAQTVQINMNSPVDRVHFRRQFAQHLNITWSSDFFEVCQCKHVFQHDIVEQVCVAVVNCQKFVNVCKVKAHKRN